MAVVVRMMLPQGKGDLDVFITSARLIMILILCAQHVGAAAAPVIYAELSLCRQIESLSAFWKSGF